MANASCAILPLLGRHDDQDLSKYSPSSITTQNVAPYDPSGSPLAAHSSVTTASSSRMSHASYESSQRGSVGGDDREVGALGQIPWGPGSPSMHAAVPPSATTTVATTTTSYVQSAAHPQRPYVPPLNLQPHMLSLSSPVAAPGDAIHAPYSNYQSYPGSEVGSYAYYPIASPVLSEHPQYTYPGHQHPAVEHQNQQIAPLPSSYGSPPMMYSSPLSPHAQTAVYAHAHQMARRPSLGMFYPYDYTPPTPPMQSPIAPYSYHPTTAAPLLSMVMRCGCSGSAASSAGQLQTTFKSGTTNSNVNRRNNNNGNSVSTLYSTSGASLASSTSSGLGRASSGRQPLQRTNTITIASGNANGSGSNTPLLSEFKGQKFKRYELRTVHNAAQTSNDIIGHIVEFSTDQHGSRFIQQKFDSATQDERQTIFDEIVPAGHGLPLMRDVFGNYVIQKMLEYGSALHRTMLCGVMEGNILHLSLDMDDPLTIIYLQAIECITLQQQSNIVAELNGHILQCVKDANGNHVSSTIRLSLPIYPPFRYTLVIQKMLERVAAERITFINAFTDNVYNLATHPYGCRVLQRCFEYSSQEQTKPLMEEIHQNAMALMQDQFGNYVIQFVLEKGTPQNRDRLIDALRGHLLIMAKHKFASNVCEKAFAVADSHRMRLYVEEMITPDANGVTPVTTMMKDQYANYVLQKAINLVEGDLLDSLVNFVLPQLVSMRRNPAMFNIKQLASIEKLLKEKGVGVESFQLHLPAQVLKESEEGGISSGDSAPTSGTPTP
ncbi:540_t:CDS:2 [Acaulospora colombiana]|uniref:540_t:CDS:1 n=1 Tax=Acaulospora colombiana TaxID=27376 RepID=A0ACA9MG62_9GLOM|nr:540_t:CDS:2 [Acaulospora colombiana]